MLADTKENVAMADEQVLSQEDKTVKFIIQHI